MLKMSVIVPTYRRPKDLARCLEALKQQTRPADEVLVVMRDTDAETWKFLEEFNADLLTLHILKVKIPGQVAALNAGLDAAKGDVIAISDDDAAPQANWLERIEKYFISDDSIGGVGGRDWIDSLADWQGTTCELVGKLQGFGRVIGNHHLGAGKPREVDVLKGVNMSFRRTALAGLRFDERLRGTGAQVHNDLAFCLALRRKGWKLIYDPLVAVNHYPAQRFDEDQRGKFDPIATTNIVHNETLALLEHLPPTRRSVFLLWAVLIGTKNARGFLQLLRFLPSERQLAWQKWLASMHGRWQGWQTWRESRLNGDGPALFEKSEG